QLVGIAEHPGFHLLGDHRVLSRAGHLQVSSLHGSVTSAHGVRGCRHFITRLSAAALTLRYAGIATRLGSAMSDITPHLNAVEADLLGDLVSAALRHLDVMAERGDAQHAPAASDHALAVQRGAGVG